MNVSEAIQQKRAIRQFAPRAVDREELERILDAGRRAHSSKNAQRWSFIVIRDRDHLRQLAAVGPYAGHLAGAAVAIALVTPDPHAPGAPVSIAWDLGGAAAQMMLEAWELGIGSCPATVYDQAMVRDLLSLPDGMHCEYLLSFGYPAKPEDMSRPNRRGGRRPVETIVHEERWGTGADGTDTA